MLKRRGSPGGPEVYMYQRKASAPDLLKTCHGSTNVSGRLLDIFSPSASRMWPRLITFLYATESKTSPAMACRL